MATRLAVSLALLGLATSAGPAAAQAWVPRAGQGGIAFSTEMIDHIGRLLDDGTRIACCGTTNVPLVVDVDYGLTNRWSVSFGVPYIFAKYRGEAPVGPAAFLPYPADDACHCLHGSFQDFEFGAHYNVLKIRRSFSLTTSVSAGIPTHSYTYAAEAAVGFALKELGLGVDAGQRLDFVVPGLAVDGHYVYTVVERALGIRHDRSDARLETSYAFPGRFDGFAIFSWQTTHGGLRFPVDVQPFPERAIEFHRLLQDNYYQAGAGVSHAVGEWELSVAFLRTVGGTNTHDVHVYTATMSRPFRVRS